MTYAEVINQQAEEDGYAEFMKRWLHLDGGHVASSGCPARWMPEGSEKRKAYLRGWLRARREAGQA